MAVICTSGLLVSNGNSMTVNMDRSDAEYSDPTWARSARPSSVACSASSASTRLCE